MGAGMTAAARRPPIRGPEPWQTVAGTSWCHFDRWFALVTVASFDGDTDALRAELVRRLRASLHGQDDAEAKLSHLADLRARMDAAGIDASVLAAAGKADRATMAKAQRKVLDQFLDGRAMTPAMRDTPRVLLARRARYGHWDRFPVSPDRWYDRLGGGRPASYVSKGDSSAAADQLRDRLARLDGAPRGLADRLALYRAFHTVGIELADRSDDSYGVIGELRLEAFRTYLAVDWASAGMAPEHYWQDLCELVVSEDFGLTHEEETLPFERVPDANADLVESILLGLVEEWRAAYGDYQADEALALVGWLHIAGRRYHRYVDAARGLGSDHWRPVAALAESAHRADRPDIAVEVFRAADRPGHHRDYLRDRCFGLTGVDLDDSPADLGHL